MRAQAHPCSGMAWRLELPGGEEFLREKGIPYEERDVTAGPGAMEELKRLAGRFITPTLVIGDEVLIGFRMNLARIVQIFRGGKSNGG